MSLPLPYAKQRVKYADTVASVLTDIGDLADGDTVTTSGYNTVDDGGGNVYTFHGGGLVPIPNEVDGGFIIDLDGIAWLEATNKTVINALQFGAVADGVLDEDGQPLSGTDNSSVLQQITDIASSSKTPVRIPKGIYVWGDGTYDKSWAFDSDLLLAGDGKSETIIAYNNVKDAGTARTSSPFLRNRNFRATAAPITTNVVIEHLAIHGIRTIENFDLTTEHFAGIAMSGVQNVTVRNCSIRNFHGDALLVEAAHFEDTSGNGQYEDGETIYQNENIRIHHNDFANCIRGMPTIISASNSWIDHNYCTGFGAGLHIEGGQSGNTLLEQQFNITFAYNKVEKVTALPFWMAGVELAIGTKFIGNDFKDITFTFETNGTVTPFMYISANSTVFSENTFRNITVNGSLFRIIGHQIDFSNNIFDNVKCDAYGLEVVGAQANPDYLKSASAFTDSTNQITITSHDLQKNDRIRFDSDGGSLPGGLSFGTRYWVIVVDENTVSLANEQNGTVVEFSGAGTGQIDVYAYNRDSGITIRNNKFYNFENQGNADASLRRFVFGTTIGSYEPPYGAQISGNIIEGSNWYYGFLIDEERVQVKDNVFHNVGGVRAIYLLPDTDSVYTGNDFYGAWNTPLYNIGLRVAGKIYNNRSFNYDLEQPSRLKEIKRSVIEQSTTDAMADASDQINTSGKVVDKLVRNTDDSRLYYASSSSPTADWNAVDSSQVVAPGGYNLGIEDIQPLTSATYLLNQVVAQGPYKSFADGNTVSLQIWTPSISGIAMTVGIYSGNAQEPQTLLGSSAEFLNADGWNEVAINVPIKVGETYWIACTQASTLNMARGTDQPAGENRYVLSTGYVYNAGEITLDPWVTNSTVTRAVTGYIVTDVKVIENENWPVPTALTLEERSADADDPPEGQAVIWLDDSKNLLAKITDEVSTDTYNLNRGYLDYQIVQQGVVATIPFSQGGPKNALVGLEQDETVTLPTLPAVDPGAYTVVFIQDAIGGWEVTWPAGVFGNKPAIDPAPAARTAVTLFFDGSQWSFPSTSSEMNRDYELDLAATANIDFTIGARNKWFGLSQNENLTLTVVDPGWYSIILLQNNTGGWQVTWPAGIDGSPPRIDPAANATTTVNLFYGGATFGWSWPARSAYYFYDKRTNIVIPSTDFVEIGNLTTDNDFQSGTYEIKFSFSYTYDTTTQSAQMRFRIDGGVWNEFSRENKDVGDKYAVYYAYPNEFSAGVHTIELQIAKGNTGDNMTVDFADTILERKL